MRPQLNITKTLGAFNGKDCGGPGHLGFFMASTSCAGFAGLEVGAFYLRNLKMKELKLTPQQRERLKQALKGKSKRKYEARLRLLRALRKKASLAPTTNDHGQGHTLSMGGVRKAEIMKDRRSGIDRRVFSYTAHIPERRSGLDRRSGQDRDAKSQSTLTQEVRTNY